jgi:uncharacterized membrane protein YkvA (DUF1232 family)
MTMAAEHYSDDGFWKKLGRHALAAGREVVEKALTLYYCLMDGDTPAWAKGVIIGALGYLIWPLDVVPDFVPVVGYGDDLGVLAGALVTVALHVKDVHVRKATATLRCWFVLGEA